MGLNDNSSPSTDTSNFVNKDSMNNFLGSADPSSGTGPSLPVSLSGIATDRYGGALQIDASTSDIQTITLADGWTGSNLQTTISSLSVDMNDVRNGDLSTGHNEHFFIAGETVYNNDDVLVPDYWLLTKSITGSGSKHPIHGTFEMNDVSGSGYSGTMGWRFDADWSSGVTVNANDQIYLSQLVSAPYREIYTADISFNYYVSASSNLVDQVFVFTRFNGYESEFHVFESGDPTGSWQTGSVSIPVAQISAITMPNSILLEIGLKSNVDGSQAFARVSNVFIDNIKLVLNVRPFPEQIDLKVDGTAVIGATRGSIYQYLDDDSARDAEDSSSSGVDLDGYPWGSGSPGILYAGTWGGSWTDTSTYQSGFQFPISIPQGAVITAAYFEIEPADDYYSADMRLYIAGEDSSGLPIENFTTGLPHMVDRYNWIDTSIDWDVTAWDLPVRNRHRSPDIAPFMQSIVSDSNWTSGNAVCLMVDYMWSDWYQAEWGIKGSMGTNNYAQDELARLFVEYMIPLPEDIVYFQQFEKDITISSSMTSATLTNFPVMIDITDSDLAADAQTDGDDIIFKLGDEALDFEIEYFNKGTGRLVAWVKIPTLSSTSNTVITMAYGNPNAGSSSTTRVWDEFETVQHLANDPSSTTYDSTANNHDGTSYGGLTSGNSVAGIGGYGISFDGVNDVISIGQIDTNDWSQFTMSVWFYHNAADDERVFSKSSTTDPNYHIITLRLDTSNRVNPRMRTNTESENVNGNVTAGTGAWHYVSWSWSASRQSVIAYLDGAPIIDDYVSGTTLYDEDSVFVIGNNDLTNSRWWNGIVDEARLTTSLRSEAWIDTEYNNQINPSAYLSVGTERAIQSTWTDAESTTVRFSTTSVTPVDIIPVVTMDISAGGQTLDENMQDGTSFYVANDTVVEWTANVLVSPPADTASMNVKVEYPLTEWKPITVTNPIGQIQAYGTDWTFHDGVVEILADAVDIWGVWKIEFESWNYAYDMKLGPDTDSSYETYSFNVGDTAEFKVSTPWIENARAGLILTDPTGSVWHTDYATTGTPGTTWDIPSFSYRMQLSVPAAQVDASVTNFPMLVSFQDNDFMTDVQADGDDFVFVQNGIVLAHEIDRFDQSTGRLVAYVRANLSSTVDNTLWLYYGNPVIGSCESPETLWSNNYEAVWLLNEYYTDDGSSGYYYDSTSNGYIGNRYGSSVTSNLVNGFAQNFDGNDYIEINSTESLNPAGDVTISGWFYIADTWTSASTPSRLLVSKWLNPDYNFHIALSGSEYTETGFTSKGSLVFGFETNNGEHMKWSQKNYWTSGWYHFACYLDADAPVNNKIYINGVDNTGGSTGGASTANLAYDGDWGIGGRYVETTEFPSGQAFHTGRIDDLRIASTVRADGWFNVTYDNWANLGTFMTRGAEQIRTSPEHTIDKLIDSSAPSGLWTASFYYNDTGASVSYATGLYERNFIVKHDTSLAIVNPTDAVVDHSTYAVAGDSLYIELELTDDVNAAKVSGATVTMNWSLYGTPTELTLNNIGNGRYGKSVDTNELGYEGQYRVEFTSDHQFYNTATEYLIIDLYHATELDYTDVDTTPIGFDFTATLIFEDSYDFTPITGATITFQNGTAVSFVDVGGGQYNISFSTGSLGYGDHVYTFRATIADSYLEDAEVTVTFTIRKHFTTASVIGDLVTPYGMSTDLTIVIIDTDTGGTLTVSNVASFILDPATGGYSNHQESGPTDLIVSLDTSSWVVGTESVTLTVTLNGIYNSPESYVFDIQIRNHYTSVTVIGDLITPYGQSTQLTLVITDTDTGGTLTAASVSRFNFTSSYGSPSESSPADLVYGLDTSAWSVSTVPVTLSVVMSGNYDSPANYQFDIQIRNHYTSVTVIGDLITPYGQSTTLTLVITDTDTGGTLTSVSVASFTFTPSSYGAQSDPSPSDLIFVLDTSTWSVTASQTVSLSVVMSGNYNNPADYVFGITIRKHYTSVTVIGDLLTPFGYATPVTVQIIDLDNGSAFVTTSSVSSWSFTSSHAPVTENNPTDFAVALTTSSWAVGTETITLSVTMSVGGVYYSPSNYQFDIEIRNHYTSVSVIGDFLTPYGDTTNLTIVIRDSDTGGTLTAASVSSFTFTSSYGSPGESTPADLVYVLDTSAWSVSTVPVTFSIILSGDYNNPQNFQFDIQIRNRRTSVTVIGNFETPFGNITPLTIVLTDADNGTLLSASDIASFTFSSSYDPLGEAPPGDLFYDLDTSSWFVGGETVTLSIVMAGNYQNPTNYVFTITIRSMTTTIINEPNDLRFPTGADLKIVVVVNVSQQGSSYGDPVDELGQAEFTIRNSTHTIPIKEFYNLSNGRYNLTVDASYFPEGSYTIYIRVSPTNTSFASCQMTLIFLYTPARSELSSPDRAAVTPYDTDFVVTLTFLDIDRDTGITGAIITATGITIYNQVEIGGGVYQVTIDVSGLPKGEHLYNLTADQIGYEAKTISFKVVIRIAFTYAIPTVGALDIPVGDDPIFYVEYWDIDHNVPINNTAPFFANSSWIHSVTFTYLPSEQRYRVTFFTNEDDELRQNFIISFNFSKGENYQFGLFNISITIRTHNTDFRLTSAVEPVTYTNNITISVFYGDLDSGTGIASEYVSFRVWNGTVNVVAYLYNVTGPGGYYTIIIPAQQFGGLGLQNFTIFFNWTGPVSTYSNKYIVTSANILGEDSRLSLLITAEPTPYLENMEYTLFYSAINGTGITNITSHVFIIVEFVGESVDLGQVTIWEVNPITAPGEYSIRFNTTLFGRTGLIYMRVYINWAKGVEPYFSNRTDTISVRILPRDTLISIAPPIQTPYSVNATFSFTFDDVTGELNEPIPDDAKLYVTISLSDYSIKYNTTTKTFTVSFDTSQFGALGTQTFTLSITWIGAPFYANQTGRLISVKVITRQTLLDYQTPSPTQYMDNVTFTVTWTDVAEASVGIESATITLYDGVVPISTIYYKVTEIGLGVYSIELNTTYKANPGTYSIKVNITSSNFYYLSRVDTRSLTIRYRSTITSSEPVNAVPYGSSFTVILYYQDIITLDIIGNTSTYVSFNILNGSSWIHSIEWKESLGYYELIVETSNQPLLEVGSTYLLRISMSYDSVSPFYGTDDAYISFEIRIRASSLERETAPVPTPYLDQIPFTVYFSDADDSSPITSATITIFRGVTQLVYGSDYTYSHVGGGVYQIYVMTTALNGLGVTTITVNTLWVSGAPYHDNATINIDLTVIRRSTNVEIVTPPSQTNYLEDIVFVVSFIDLGTGTEIATTKDNVTILNGGVPLTPAQFSFIQIGATLTYEIRINSADIDSNLVVNRILTVSIDWPDSPNYYKDDSTSTTVTTIARRTYVSVDRPGNTPYGENATFTLTFIDSTTLPENLIIVTPEMSIVTNLTENPSISWDGAIITISFNTSQFGNVGLAGFYLNITWSGTPFYANKTLQIVYVTITMRQTQIDYNTPAPTPYGDTVTFDVSYIDISGSTEVGIPDATLTIYYLGVPVPGANYIATPDGFGNFEIQFDTDFFSQPGYYSLNVSLVYTGGYFREDASGVRTLNVRYRTTILSANPVGQIGYETTLEITLTYQDILTLANIDNTSTSFEILNDTGIPWVYTLTWRPATSDYLLSITTVGQTTLTLGDHSLWLNMSYASAAPFYRWDDLYVEFSIRTRTSALDLQEAAIPAPYLENISFVVYYWDADVTQGISGADFILNSGALTEGIDFFVVDGTPGIYTIYIDSSALGGLGTYIITVQAVWPGGAPYHNNAQRTVSVSTIRRTATVEVLEPPNQPRYLDNLVFTFAFVDSINGLQISITSANVKIYAGGSLLTPVIDYTLTPDGFAFLVTINSTVLASTLVSNYNVTVLIDWNDGSSPFYVDDTTSMKVTTTQRIILIEPQQIETTPVGDRMNITFYLTDEDSDKPVSGAVILFSCVSDPGITLIENSEYTLDEYAPGRYLISLISEALVGGEADLGEFRFSLIVQWNPLSQPFYKNRTAIYLTGSVDRIQANMLASVSTQTVQIFDNVTIIIELRDVDHNKSIEISEYDIQVTYYGTGITPSMLSRTSLGSGFYSIEFSTVGLGSIGSYSVNTVIISIHTQLY